MKQYPPMEVNTFFKINKNKKNNTVSGSLSLELKYR